MDKEKYLKFRDKVKMGDVDMELCYEFYKENYKNPIDIKLFIKLFPIWFQTNAFTFNYHTLIEYYDKKFGVQVLSNKDGKELMSY